MGYYKYLSVNYGILFLFNSYLWDIIIMGYFNYLSVNYGLLLWLIIRIHQSIMDYDNYALL